MFFSEARDSTYLSYTLNDNEVFFDIGYKVLKNQENSGFIKCKKIMKNGRINLIYDISKYRDIESFLENIPQEKKVKVIINIFKLASTIKDNGFIEYKNINTSLEDMFIDINTLEVSFLYIPININNKRDEKIFLNELKMNILRALKKGSYNSFNHDISSIIAANEEIRAIIREIIKLEEEYINGLDKVPDNLKNKRKIDKKYQTEDNNNSNYDDERSNYINQLVSYNSNNRENKRKEKPKSKGMFGNLFSKKNKNINAKNQVTLEKKDNLENNTMLLTDYKSEKNKKIFIEVLNSKKTLRLEIDKKEFIIGASRELADGIISFNKAISRKHCKIVIQGNEFKIVDLGSSNGTFVNGKKLFNNEMVTINHGDIIKLANTEFIVKNF